MRELQTNADGCCDEPLLPGEDLLAGVYELHFRGGDYYRRRGVELAEPAFLDVVVLRVAVPLPRAAAGVAVQLFGLPRKLRLPFSGALQCPSASWWCDPGAPRQGAGASFGGWLNAAGRQTLQTAERAGLRKRIDFIVEWGMRDTVHA